MNVKSFLIGLIIILTTYGCTYLSTNEVSSVNPPSMMENMPLSKQPILTADPTVIIVSPTKEPILSITAYVSPIIQPTDAVSINEAINPLTGLPVDDPKLLDLSPILISVSNFPVSVRPQSGLSFAPHVFEFTIGEGMTRFLAVYYGNYGPIDKMDIKLGSIRSGRLPFEQLRTMYDGMIVMAGADPTVGAKLNATVFRETITFSGIEELAIERSKRRGTAEFAGLTFAAAAPSGGKIGTQVEILWNNRNRVRWIYNPILGKYLREQDKSDGKDTYYSATDKLTGEQLAFDNVVLLAVEHEYLSPTKIDMNLVFVKKEPALFFRDGKSYKIYWTTLSPLGPIQFINEDGSPFGYKPGNSWYEVIHSLDEVGTGADGIWKVDFFNP